MSAYIDAQTNELLLITTAMARATVAVYTPTDALLAASHSR